MAGQSVEILDNVTLGTSVLLIEVLNAIMQNRYVPYRPLTTPSSRDGKVASHDASRVYGISKRPSRTVRSAPFSSTMLLLPPDRARSCPLLRGFSLDRLLEGSTAVWRPPDAVCYPSFFHHVRSRPSSSSFRNNPPSASSSPSIPNFNVRR
jgi:hypothetical protein